MTVKYRDYFFALNKLTNEVRRAVGDDWENRIHLYEIPRASFDEPVKLGISWAAIGTVELDKAAEFSEKLAVAIEMAKSFKYNGYVITF